MFRGFYFLENQLIKSRETVACRLCIDNRDLAGWLHMECHDLRTTIISIRIHTYFYHNIYVDIYINFIVRGEEKDKIMVLRDLIDVNCGKKKSAGGFRI